MSQYIDCSSSGVKLTTNNLNSLLSTGRKRPNRGRGRPVLLRTRMRGCSLRQTFRSPGPGRCRLWPRPHSSPAGASQPLVDHHALRPASRGTSAPHSAARCCCTPGQETDRKLHHPHLIKSSITNTIVIIIIIIIYLFCFLVFLFISCLVVRCLL